MAREADVFIGWTHGPVDEKSKKFFERDTVFIAISAPPASQGNKYMTQLSGFGWPHPIRGILNRYAPKDLVPQRIGLIGFSESCAGVLAILQSADAQYIDTAVAIDGIHTSFIGGSPNKNRSNISVANLAPWMEYASISASDIIDPGGGLAFGRRHCIITHSSIVPPNYVSTTETANSILTSIFGNFAPRDPIPEGVYNAIHDPPIVFNGNKYNQYKSTQYDKAASKYWVHKEGLYVFGYNNLDSTGINDHIYQAQVVLPTVLQKIVAPNWNSIDPKSALCIPGTASYNRAEYEMASLGYDSSANNNCVIDPPVVMPPASSSAPDRYLDYKKWVPKDQQNDTNKTIETVQKMSAAMRIFWMLSGMGLLYAGAKTVEKVVRK